MMTRNRQRDICGSCTGFQVQDWSCVVTLPNFPVMLNIIQCSWGVLQSRLETALLPKRFCCVPARKDGAGLQTEPFCPPQLASHHWHWVIWQPVHLRDAAATHVMTVPRLDCLRPYVEQGTWSPMHSHTHALLCPSLFSSDSSV